MRTFTGSLCIACLENFTIVQRRTAEYSCVRQEMGHLLNITRRRFFSSSEIHDKHKLRLWGFRLSKNLFCEKKLMLLFDIVKIRCKVEKTLEMFLYDV